MHETVADLDALRALLDRSHDAAGPHKRRVITARMFTFRMPPG